MPPSELAGGWFSRPVAQWGFVAVAVAGAFAVVVLGPGQGGASESASSGSTEIGQALRGWDADQQQSTTTPAPSTSVQVTEPGPAAIPERASMSMAAEYRPLQGQDGQTSTTASTTTEAATTATSTTTTGVMVEDELERKIITLIGDETVSNAEAELRVALAPGAVAMRASEGRTLADAHDDIGELNGSGRLDSVVVSLGTHDVGTGPAWESEVADAMDTLADVPCVVWVDLRETNADLIELNEIVARQARSRPNIEVARWSLIADSPDLHAADGAELSQLGRARLAILVGATVRTCLAPDSTTDAVGAADAAVALVAEIDAEESAGPTGGDG